MSHIITTVLAAAILICISMGSPNISQILQITYHSLDLLLNIQLVLLARGLISHNNINKLEGNHDENQQSKKIAFSPRLGHGYEC